MFILDVTMIYNNIAHKTVFFKFLTFNLMCV